MSTRQATKKELAARSVFEERWDSKTGVLTIVAGEFTFKTFNGRSSVGVKILAGDAWRWHARASNGRLVATAGESFAKRGNAERAMRRFIAGVRK